MTATNTFCNSTTRKLPRTKVVDDAVLPRIHEATVKLLAETGIIFEHDEALEIFRRHGAKVEGKIVYIPRKMAEAAMEQTPTTYRHEARNQEQSVTIGDGIAPHPNVGCVFCEDMDRGKRRGLLEDYANFQKLSQASNYCKLTGATPVAPNDVEASERALYMLFETIKHTDKPLIGSCTIAKKARESLHMVEMVFGERLPGCPLLYRCQYQSPEPIEIRQRIDSIYHRICPTPAAGLHYALRHGRRIRAYRSSWIHRPAKH